MTIWSFNINGIIWGYVFLGINQPEKTRLAIKYWQGKASLHYPRT
jgi:hypothetical protein